MVDPKELHSGDYVRRFEVAPVSRIARIVERLTIPKDADIGDFGCGTGILLHALGVRHGTYTGVDFSSDFVASARRWAEAEKLSNWRFVEADIVEFCDEHTECFDVATALDFTEHVETVVLIRILSSIRKSIRPGGRLYLHTPNLDFLIERAKDLGILRQFPEHVAVRNANQMMQLLIDSGFSPNKVRIETIPHYNILRVLHPLRYLPLVGRAFEARLLVTAEV